MRHIANLLTILILALGVVAGASAQSGFMPWTDVVMMADTNDDGMMTEDEVKKFMAADHFVGFQPFMKDHFKNLDANGDGMVSMAEVKMFAKNQMQWSDPQISEMFYKGQGFMPKQ
ncbi:MAG: hypothetical protein AAF384_03505 [Pseudomonadota bacterium]